MSIRLLCGDALEQLRLLEENSVDAVVTDPPYGIGFMGKTWDNFGGPLGVGHGLQRAGGREAGGAMKAGDSYDRSLSGQHGFQSWCEVWAVEALRVAKPGAHLLAFGGTRTFHRLTCAIEDAGWEIRDCLGWIYGSGFPKSLNAAVAVARSVDPTWEIGSPYPEAAIRWQGWGTGLKPAWEPIILARKPLEGTVAENVQKWGTGALNIDGCRVSAGDFEPKDRVGAAKLMEDRPWQQQQREEGRPRIIEGNSLGRWPANLLHDGSEEVVGMFPQAGSSRVRIEQNSGRADESQYRIKPTPGTVKDFGDSGSAARFFKACSFSGEDLCDFAITADVSSNQRSEQGDFVLGDAATSEVHGDAPLNEESRATVASIGSCSGSIPSRGLVSNVVDRGNTGTIPTTGNRSKSSGCVNPATTVSTLEIERSEPKRFLYCPKASRAEREEGLDGTPERPGGMVSNTSGQHLTRRDGGAPGLVHNNHPTVKPLALMRYLCRLVTPPGGTVLDPFMGSGSTGKAALLEGFGFIGIDNMPEYVEIARRRIEGTAPLFAEVKT